MRLFTRIVTAVCLLFGILPSVAQTSLDTAVNFTVNDVHGNTHRLYDYLAEGKIVLLDFFTVTCGPCAEYTPEISKTYAHFGCNAGNVVVLGINWGAGDQEVIEFGETYGAKYPEVSGTEGNGNHVVSDYGILSYPSVFLVLPDHSIPLSNIWPPESETLDSLLIVYGGNPIDCNVGVAENLSRYPGKTSLELFPNPAREFFFIQPPEGFRLSSVEIISETGQILTIIYPSLNQDVTEVHTVNVRFLPPGCYIIRARDDKNSVLQGLLLKSAAM